MLERVRGTKSVDAEFTDICEAVEVSNAISGKWRALFSKKYRGVLVSTHCSAYLTHHTSSLHTMVYMY